MRVPIGKALRVGLGDEVIVRGRLVPAESVRLGRLYVFAKTGTAEFAPYVLNVVDKMAVGGKPVMMTPMSMRLTERERERELSFIADIDGYIRVMQELDTRLEPRAEVKLSRRICPYLPWHARLQRKLSGILSWRH